MEKAFPATAPEVSIIVPARNEEVCLGDCLQSLVTQDGVAFEIIVVDDGSTDRTREIAESFSGVQVISPGPLPAGWTGKNNAVVAGAKEARGSWLLFTDADTVHVAGSLARALAEAKEYRADLLSYSPEQIAVTFWEMATLPVVFAELAREYPPSKVSDPTLPIAAANGQYMLIRREVYDAVGGHAAIGDSLLEDVALARAVKSSGHSIRFRYAADAVRARMYRNLAQLREGWTKNLALLFKHPTWMAVGYSVESFILLAVVSGVIQVLLFGLSPIPSQSALLPHNPIPDRYFPLFQWWMIGCDIFLLLFLLLRSAGRVITARFPLRFTIISMMGPPVFAYLLFRSTIAHSSGNVHWKGRAYTHRGLLTTDY